jgi:2,3-bisphosphoglycerate-independent phosphoglycerate mutase
VKYVVIIGDGMADFPLEEFQGKTPLMKAEKPFMDMMAKAGICGNVLTVPEGFPPGSDVACMSIFGYDPARYYTGRAPIEAYGMGLQMGPEDVAFRCNLVHLDFDVTDVAMKDFSAGHIGTDEAAMLMAALNSEMGNEEIHFYPGVGYRHIMMWKGGLWQMETTPPHDITGKAIGPYLPGGDGAARVREWMTESRQILAGHPVNDRRGNEGKLTANSIWLWGQGKRAELPLFEGKYGVSGATVTAVDLIKGISKMVGFDAPHVEGATGYLDTNYAAKAEKAMELLAGCDIVYIHIEAPDEASHSGNVKEKIKAIESIDREIVGRLYERLGNEAKFLIVTDHATPISMMTHYATPVPYAIFHGGTKQSGCPTGYHELCGSETLNGEELIRFFLKG